jgi:TonB family protein
VDLPGFQQGKFIYNLSDPGYTRLNFTLSIAPLTTVVDIAAQAPPGLKCFSIFGAFKSDGTPFTEADCPGGTLVIGATTPRPLVAVPAEPPPTAVIVSNAPTATIPTTGQRLPIRVGGDVQAGNLVYHPSPAYPSEARAKGIEGAVVLSGVISKDGQLRALRIISSSNSLLETSTIETIQNWTYKPTLLNREPVETLTTITLNFTLGR